MRKKFLVMLSKNRTSVFLIFILFSINLFVFSSQITSSKTIVTFNELPSVTSLNASSPIEYFNETKHPRYDLVARPLDVILEPHKGNPIIIEYGENFTITHNISSIPQFFILYLVNEENTIDLEILDSYTGIAPVSFRVKPTVYVEGLYDLQLNSTSVTDYQTHCVKIVEKKQYPFKFVHISDCHFPSYTDINTTDINLRNIAEIRDSGADFAIFTGDLIEGPAWEFVNPVDDKPLAAEIQLRLGLWALDLLEMPVFIIGGNHDLDATSVLSDNPEEVWKRYLGSSIYPIVYFFYANWSFIGYSATNEGISDSAFAFVDGVLDAGDRNESPSVLFYHSDYKNQSSNLRSRNKIEVMLFGHEHHEELFVQDLTLYHCEAPLFNNGSSIFTVLNKTSLSLYDIVYDFTILLQPTVESSFSNYLFFGIIPLFVSCILYRKKKIANL